MGWTHYWRRAAELPTTEFEAAVADCREILEASGISLRGGQDSDAPWLTGDEIVFNGAEGAGCEPFVFGRVQQARPGRDVVRGYCKTEHMPYDLVVQCCLVVLKHHLGDAVQITSDSGDEGWKGARRLCEECLGYGSSFALDET